MSDAVATASRRAPDADDDDTPVLVVLGLDESGKSHASWFGQADAELARKAAGMMEMAVLPISSVEVKGAAAGLPKGKVFASGKAFVPFVKAGVYEKLIAFLPEADRPKKPKAKKKTAAPAKKGKPEEQEAPPPLPASWNKIEVGALVMASLDPFEPWFKCIVVSERANGLFVLRWRDYPDDPKIVRRREDIALLHPEHATA